MQIQNLPKAIAPQSDVLKPLSKGPNVTGIQLPKMPVMSVDSFQKREEEEESDGSYKRPVTKDETGVTQANQNTSSMPETTPIEEFFLPEPPVQGQGVNTDFDWRTANYGREGNYATELMYQTYEQLGMYDTDWSAMPPEEAEQLQKEIRDVAHSVFIEFFERDVAAWIEKGVHSCNPATGQMYDKEGNEIKPKQLSDSAYDAQVAEKMFDVLDFLKESNSKAYDLMVAWREANGLDTDTE